MSHRLDLHPSDVGFMNVHTQGTFISPPCLIYSVYISISLCKPSSLVYRWVPYKTAKVGKVSNTVIEFRYLIVGYKAQQNIAIRMVCTLD